MFSKLVLRQRRGVNAPCVRLTALIHSDSGNLFTKSGEQRDPFEDLAKTIDTPNDSLKVKDSKKAGSVENILKEDKILNECVEIIHCDSKENENHQKVTTAVGSSLSSTINTRKFNNFFPNSSVTEVLKAVNSDLRSCNAQTFSEINTYLDKVDKLDPDSEEWDVMTSLIAHPDENREIKYDLLPRVSSSVGSYIEYSETLQKLVMLGVDLSAVEEFPFIANFLIRQDFNRDIVPKLLYLKDLGVYDHNIGQVLTTNPYILEDPIDKLQTVVDYLKSKRFTADMIGKMVVRHSMFLIMEVGQIDSKLGMLQKMFHLTGDQVREIFSTHPVLISHNRKKIQDVHFLLHNIWEFEKSQIRAIFLKCPLIFAEDAKKAVQSRLEILHAMGITTQKLSECPAVLMASHHQVRRRHAFLKEIGRAHYDPEKAGYVSLESLGMYSVDKWCWKMNIPKEHYMKFLKTE
ncbi:transcription termination factor 3, mitochondrial-like [Saccostrea cucullata]|uniref:transcription termination factor 3, mitochondrial-like n=1 Tax=Saccostrea cuccullata TaxID=36930 RepID=UPI002ED62909